MVRLFVFCFALFICQNCLAQSYSGLPFITNFSSSDYQQGPQNFTVLQDRQGIFYFGNNNGVLLYDGVRWDLLQVTNKSEVHSLAEDMSGRLYVGAQGDFGYIQPTSTGKLQFVSLLHLLDSADQNFNDVWSIHPTLDGIVFRSTKGIYIYKDERIKVIDLPNSSHRSFWVEDAVWIRIEGVGLQKLEGDSLRLLPGGDQFIHESIHAILPFDNGRHLLVTENRGLLLYDGVHFSPLNTPVNNLIKGQNTCAQVLNDSTYAIGTRRNGLIVMHKSGAIKNRIGKTEGIIDESIWSIANDRYTKNVWLATNNGVSVLELESPFTSFQDHYGLSGQFYSLVEHQGSFYAAGSLGVFKKSKIDSSTKNEDAKFQSVPGLATQAWHFYADSTTLLTSANNGIFQINAKGVTNIGFTGRAWYLLPLLQHPGYILANTAQGLILLKKNKNTFIIHRFITQKFESLYYFVEDSHGDVWVNSPIKGIYRLQFTKGMDYDPVISIYTTKDGLPSNYKLRPFQLQEGVVVGSEAGLYKFNRNNNRFEWHTTLNEQLFDGNRVSVELLKEDNDGVLWGYINQPQNKKQSFVGFMAIPNEEGTYTVDRDLFKRMNSARVHDIITLDRENIFLSTANGIVHLNSQRKGNSAFPVSIRSVELLKADSLYDLQTVAPLKIPFAQNSLRFSFAGMGFIESKTMEYSLFLEGFDKKWSDFSSKPEKEYTNLPAGGYVFRVKARNYFNNISDEATYEFTITPPWYQTTWAYLFYMLTAAGLIYLFSRWRSSNLIAANLRLEFTIEQRTKEIKQQNSEILEKNQLLENQKEEIEAQKEDIEQANNIIASQNENLKYINLNLEKIVTSRTEELQTAYTDLLALKNELDTFIYRSSHDIKGPLMRLLGLCHVAKLDVTDKPSLQYIHLLENEITATNRILQKLIVYHYVKNAVPTAERFNLSYLIEKMLLQIERLPGYHDSSITYTKSEDLWIETDLYLLETALVNIVENGVLYAGLSLPRVDIHHSLTENELVLHISDNGKGIDPLITENIFNMFFRGTEHSKGAGLGLYIAKEALKKINGTVELSSRAGWTTTFQIKIPIHATKQREIVALAGT